MLYVYACVTHQLSHTCGCVLCVNRMCSVVSVQAPTLKRKAQVLATSQEIFDIFSTSYNRCHKEYAETARGTARFVEETAFVTAKGVYHALEKDVYGAVDMKEIIKDNSFAQMHFGEAKVKKYVKGYLKKMKKNADGNDS